MSTITLTIPPGREFHDVAQLVVGGVASRLQFTVDELEDIQLAIGELLVRQGGEGPLTIELAVEEHGLGAAIGPFDAYSLVAHLEDQEGIGLRRVLDAVVDRVELDERHDGGWVRLTKRLERGDRAGVRV